MSTEPQAPHPEAELLAEPMRSRWSPSVYDPDHEVSDAQVTTLLSAARWSASAGNSQPWRLVVLRRGTQAHAAFVETLSRGNTNWVPRASLVVVMTTQVGPDRDGKEPTDHAWYDAGQAAAHLTLQAQAMGLSAHQFSGFDHAAAGAALGVPASHAVISGIAVGVKGSHEGIDERLASRDQRPRTRLPLQEIGFAEQWGHGWDADAPTTEH